MILKQLISMRLILKISRYLNKDCRLVFIPFNSVREIDTKYALHNEQVGFADGFPLLLLSQASLDLLASKTGYAISALRFRPNIVISGVSAHDEDSWQRINIKNKQGDVALSIVKPCERCVIPSLDLATQRPTKNFNKTLASYRRDSQGRVVFGQNAMLSLGNTPEGTINQGEISLGDKVEIIR